MKKTKSKAKTTRKPAPKKEVVIMDAPPVPRRRMQPPMAAPRPTAPRPPMPMAGPPMGGPGMADPPMFKKGGTVKKTGMALVHKGEKVLTKQQQKKCK
jgi:hypothetical protein